MRRHLAVTTIAGLLSLFAVLLAAGGAAAQSTPPIGAYKTDHAWKFLSAPRLHPPRLITDRPTVSGSLAKGYYFIANFKNLSDVQSDGTPDPLQGAGGPVILDNKLRPVWAAPIPDTVYSLNFEPQTYQGKPALSWWQGVVGPTGAVSDGQYQIYDQHYRKIGTLVGQQGWTLSMHEFLLRQGSDCDAPGWSFGNDECAWVTAYKNVPGAQIPGGPANVTIVDSAVQEYDVKTGALVYSWDAGQHIPLSESQTQAFGGFWDPYHVNSINLTGKGQFLTSMRNTWAGYLVNESDGSIVWTLGGNASSYALPSNGTFHWQHNMEFHGSDITLFDDDCCAVLGPGKFAPPEGPTRGLVLSLDSANHTASVVAQYTFAGRYTSTQGNMDSLSNGNVVLGWGQASWFSEYNKQGKLLLDAAFPTPDISYRTYKANWVGTPFYKPNGLVRRSGKDTTAFASWDGSTKLAAWRVLGGSNPKHLSVLVKSKRKQGFETWINVPRPVRKDYKVVALDSKGHVLSRSKVLHSVRKGRGGYGGNGGGGTY